jgi:hypothetical protein
MVDNGNYFTRVSNDLFEHPVSVDQPNNILATWVLVI